MSGASPELIGGTGWLALAALTASAFLLLPTARAAAAITPVGNTAADAATLATAISASPYVTGASFDPAPPNLTTPNGTANAPLSSFPTDGGSFSILTPGDVTFADDANGSPDTGLDLNGGTAQDGPHARGDTDYDVTVLRVDMDVPASVNCLTIDFQFYSEEFPEFVNSEYNDAFIAELDSSTWTTSGSTISAPGNFAFDPTGSEISINASGTTSMSDANAAGTTYDGATPLLAASKPVTPVPHTLYLSIFDQGDQIYDSAVFLDNLRLTSVADPKVSCQSGARPKNDPPETEITAGPAEDETLPVDHAGFEFAADEPGSTFECSIDGATFTACETPLTTPGLEDGGHRFEVRATDVDGNTDRTPARRNFGTLTKPCAGKQVTIYTRFEQETVEGTPGDDVILGGPKRDVVIAGGGDDTVCDREGNDEIKGGAGDDKLRGGPDDDLIKAGGGADILSGRDGSDKLRGGPGKDFLNGNPGADTLNGDGGIDRCKGGAGTDKEASCERG